MKKGREFDVVVVGAGPAGEVCAGRLAKGGCSVAIVEQELVGGECSFYACMPSKALLRPAQALAEARRLPGAAQAATGQLGVADVLSRRDEVIHDLSDEAQLPWLEERSITLVRGHGELAGPRLVRVGEEHLHATRAVVLATGTRAATPPIPGLAGTAAWSNRQAATAKSVPASLVVLGGGVVGVEMADAYRSLGASVTIVERLPRLIAAEEEFASELLAKSLADKQVEVILGVGASSVSRQGDAGPFTVGLQDGRTLQGDELLVAVGRTPLTDDLGLQAVGLSAGRPVEVGPDMRVEGQDWLYAVGDANGRALLTHMGKYQGRLAADSILGRPMPLLSDGRLSPRVVFTDPQVAAVGHTLAGARDAGLDVRAADVAFGANAGGSFVGRGEPGLARIVVDETRRVIVGATFAGVEVAESLHAATIAVIGEVPLERLWHAVPAFPTRSEVWLNLLEGYGL